MNDHSQMYNIHGKMQIQFLEQISDQAFWDYAQSLATQENTAPATDEEVLEFQVDSRRSPHSASEWRKAHRQQRHGDSEQPLQQGHYLLPLHALREVVPPPHKLTLLPFCPVWMLGITAWRGHVIPVVDLTSYFISHKTNEPDTTQHAYLHSNSILLILDDATSLLGIQIEAVGSIITLGQTQLASPEQAPSWYPRRLLPTLLGVYNGSVVLNPQMLIAEMMQHIKVSAAYE